MTQTRAEEIKAKRIAALAKAREARAAKRKLSASSPEVPKAAPLPKLDIVEAVKTLDYGPLTYEQCCELCTAFRNGFDEAAKQRNRKAEQIEALSTHVPCTNCGKKIDVSKSGGFQIRTEMDKSIIPWRMVNRYYCSQNCLLGIALMGKERTKPGAQR